MSDNHEDIERLLRLSGPREAVASERALRVRSAVQAEWRQQTRARSRKRAVGWLSVVAAAALLVVGLRVAIRPTVTSVDPGAIVGTLEATGENVRTGSVVDTTDGGFASIRLSGGAMVRLDRGTRLRVISSSAVALEQGGTYVDSGRTSPSPGLEVHTAFGVARDIGTRFEVRVGASTFRVRVRDGRVQLRRDRESYEAKTGEELALDADGSIARRNVPVYGPDWEWAVAAAKPFEIEGRSLREFLDWIATENGWQLRFADAAVEQTSSTTILHGSIQGLTSLEALATVLPASGVRYHLDRGVLLIGPAG